MPLSELGEDQAVALGRWIAEQPSPTSEPRRAPPVLAELLAELRAVPGSLCI